MGTYIAISAPPGLFAVEAHRAPYEREVTHAIIGAIVAQYVGKNPGIEPHLSMYSVPVNSSGRQYYRDDNGTDRQTQFRVLVFEEGDV